MAQNTMTTAGAVAPPARSASTGGLLLRIVSLALLDAFTIWFCYRLIVDGNIFLALTVAVITLLINYFFMGPQSAYPYRWFTPGLALMILLVLYPTGFTLYIAFTNYGTGNILTQPQAIRQIERQTYAADDAPTYAWTAYQNESANVLLWLEAENGDIFLTRPDEPFVPLAESEFNVEGTDAPDTLGDFTQVSPFIAATNPAIVGGTFGVGTEAVQIPANGGDALALQPLYTYDAENNTVTS
ncbi:MAG: hypothetical protein AAF787_20780, partial [Chloroflexota bacterium]